MAVLALIWAYKVLLSSLFAGSCRFLPSCSEYAAQAVDTHGVFRGGWLAARRLGRCHPFSRPGYDPVPEQGIVKWPEVGAEKRPPVA